MKVKKIFLYLFILVFLFACFLTTYFLTINHTKVTFKNNSTIKASAKDYSSENNNIINKNTKIVIKDNYLKGDGFTKISIIKPNQETIGMNYDQAEDYFKLKGYRIYEFTSKSVTITKDIDTWPSNAYVIKGEKNSTTIYSVNKDGQLIEYQKTELNPYDLPLQDRIELLKGKIYERYDEIESLLDEYTS